MNTNSNVLLESNVANKLNSKFISLIVEGIIGDKEGEICALRQWLKLPTRRVLREANADVE